MFKEGLLNLLKLIYKNICIGIVLWSIFVKFFTWDSLGFMTQYFYWSNLLNFLKLKLSFEVDLLVSYLNK